MTHERQTTVVRLPGEGRTSVAGVKWPATAESQIGVCQRTATRIGRRASSSSSQKHVVDVAKMVVRGARRAVVF